MKVVVTGYGPRSLGPRTIGTFNVVGDVKETNIVGTMVRVDDKGAVHVSNKAANLTLTGNYRMRVEISRREVARLFRETFGDVTVDEAIKALTKAS